MLRVLGFEMSAAMVSGFEGRFETSINTIRPQT